MKRVKIISYLVIFSFFLSVEIFGQAKKPTLMVLPLKNWCVKNGYTVATMEMGKEKIIEDYQAVVDKSSDFNNTVAVIDELMANENFPLEVLQQALAAQDEEEAEDIANNVNLSPADAIANKVKPDILLLINWEFIPQGPKKAAHVTLQAIDAYTHKDIAPFDNRSDYAFSEDPSGLIKSALNNGFSNFLNKLQNYFEDLQENGREISIDVKIRGDEFDMEETEVDGETLSETIYNWFDENAQNHRFSESSSGEKFLQYKQVRIPLYNEKGRAIQARQFAQNLVKFLKEKNIPSKIQSGAHLGHATILIGNK